MDPEVTEGVSELLGFMLGFLDGMGVLFYFQIMFVAVMLIITMQWVLGVFRRG
jgi:hypothetical protein